MVRLKEKKSTNWLIKKTKKEFFLGFQMRAVLGEKLDQSRLGRELF